MDSNMAMQEMGNWQMEQLELGQEWAEAEQEAMREQAEQAEVDHVVFDLRGDLQFGERLATIALI